MKLKAYFDFKYLDIKVEHEIESSLYEIGF